MTYTTKDKLFLAIIGFILVACIIGLIVEKRDHIQFKRECEKAGGQYYRPYGSTPLCLTQGSIVVPLATATRG